MREFQSFADTFCQDYDDYCNIGEKHSTFFFAYAADFDPYTFADAKKIIVQTISNDRHNYTKLAAVRFDTQQWENIIYYDDVASFSKGLDELPPVASLASNALNASNVLDVIRSFLNATGRPLESSMILIFVNRFPAYGTGLEASEFDTVTNNNVKIFPMVTDKSYDAVVNDSTRYLPAIANLASNSNGHFAIAATITPFINTLTEILSISYSNSLAFTRSVYYSGTLTDLGILKVPRARTGIVNFTVSITMETGLQNSYNTNGVRMTFSQTGSADQFVDLSAPLANTNYYYGSVQLKPRADCKVTLQTTQTGANVFVRIWTSSMVYHYGSYAAIDDPMGGTAISQVDAYGGAALRMRLMNDCYSDYEASIIITDCRGAVSAKYDSVQTIPTQYIFVDEGSFPHYPFVPFFCGSNAANAGESCVPGTFDKYDIQFVAGEFTVVRSFQCRPGVGRVDPKCQNIDDNGNVYCNRTSIPYMRGPTGQLTDCLGHGHLEFDFDDTQSYICVCDDSYSGASCQTQV
ncbi:unnamed protein product [Caenorhabditis sp. 36 PRJEB53466]|nr:unnamed protein product [Caenorhabditis sp. 36 PRJEB53466]